MKALAARALCLLALAAGPASAQTADPSLAPVEALVRQGRYAEAERALRSRPADDAEAAYLLGFTLIRLYRFAEAEEALARATERRPERHVWLHALAKARQEQGKNLAAIAALDRALALADRPEYRFARAMCALNVGDLESAEKELVRAITGDPGNAEARYKLAKILVDRGDYAEALPLLGAALRVQPDHLEARFLLGLASSRTGDLEAAAAAFDAVLERVPGHVGALFNSSRVLLRLGREAEGRARLDRFAEMSEIADRIDFTTRAVKRNPENLEGRLELARLLLEAGRSAEALDELMATRALAPRHPPIYRLLGDAFERLGRPDDASQARAFATRLAGGGG